MTEKIFENNPKEWRKFEQILKILTGISIEKSFSEERKTQNKISLFQGLVGKSSFAIFAGSGVWGSILITDFDISQRGHKTYLAKT